MATEMAGEMLKILAQCEADDKNTTTFAERPEGKTKKQEAFERQLRYAFDLVKMRAEYNYVGGEGEADVYRVLPLDSNAKVMDLMASKNNK